MTRLHAIDGHRIVDVKLSADRHCIRMSIVTEEGEHILFCLSSLIGSPQNLIDHVVTMTVIDGKNMTLRTTCGGLYMEALEEK